MVKLINYRENIEDAFFQSARSALKLHPSDLEHMKHTHNLFVWQNILMEFGGAFALSKDKSLLAHGKLLIGYLARGGWSKQNFPEELHWAFVLNGIVVFLEHTRDFWTTAELNEVDELITNIGEHLYTESIDQEWGRNIRKRNAWNHTAIAFSSIAVAGIISKDKEKSKIFQDIGVERVLNFFRDGITNRGMTWEGLAYCGFVFRNIGIMLNLLRQRKIWDYQSSRDNPFIEKLSRIPDWYEVESFPTGGFLQNWNNSYWNPNHALRGFLMTFRDLAPARSAIVWNRLIGSQGNGSFGRDSSFRTSCIYESALYFPDLLLMDSCAPIHSFYCPEVGYAVGSVGERAATSRLSFNSGEYIGAIHDQSDNNSFTLFLDGLPIIIDSGTHGGDAIEGSASSSFGHNGVIVDGKGQLPSGDGSGCSGNITDVRSGVSDFFVSGDAVRAYAAHDYNPLIRANRQCFLVNNKPYAAIFDDYIKDSAEHDFTLFLHTPLLEDKIIDVNTGLVSGTIEFFGRRARLTIRVLYPEIASIEFEIMESDDLPFLKHARWAFNRKIRQAIFITVIFVESIDEPEMLWEFDHEILISDEQVNFNLRWLNQHKQDNFIFKRQVARQDHSATSSFLRRELVRDAHPTPITVVKQNAVDVQSQGILTLLNQHANEAAKLAGFARALAATDYPIPPRQGVVMGQVDFREVGLEFLGYFLKWGDLLPDDDVLDIGCGGGRMAAPLGYYLSNSAHYLGFDIHEASVEWCRNVIGRRWKNFHFDFFDISNSNYNIKGKDYAEKFEFPYRDGQFSFLIAISVFTHMARAEVAQYLHQAARVMKKGGCFFCTVFLLTPEAEASMNSNSRAVMFQHELADSLVHDLQRPMAAVAQKEENFRSDITAAGLVIDRIAYGQWSCLETSNSKQDIILLRKP